MKPPLLQTAWHNRAFFAEVPRGPWHEWFGVGALCPSGRRAFWAWYCLHRGEGAGVGARAEVVAHLSLPGRTEPRRLAEVYPAEQVALDPERAGMAVGHNALGDSGLGGRLGDAAGMLAWQLELDARVAPWLPIPSGRLFPHGLGAVGLSVPVLAGRARGYLEVADGEGRHRTVERVEVDGWRVFQWHRWGRPPAGPHALMFAEQPEPPGTPPTSRLIALGSPWRLGPGRARAAVWARLWHQGELLRFDTWRQLLGSSSQIHGAAWAFTATGGGASLNCRVDLPAAASHSGRLAALGGELVTTHAGRLQADLVRAGRAERLPLTTAACQLVA